MQKTKKQHFVPQFLLRKFAYNPNAKVKRLHIHDKWENRSYPNSVGNVGCKNSLYDIGEVSLEPALEKLDSRTADVINKILKEEALPSISQSDLMQLGTFLCVQLVRTMQSKDIQNKLTQFIFELAEKRSGNRIVNGETESPQEEQIAFLTLLKDCTEFLPHLSKNKIWFLLKACEGEEFQIGDCPFVRNNRIPIEHEGNLGLASPGIELYLPLSSKIILAVYCESLGEAVRKKLSEYRMQAFMKTTLPSDFTEFDHLIALENAMTGGPACVCNREMVMYLNSLQIKWARRYIFSKSKDFSLVKKMLEDAPEHKGTIKPSFS